MQIILVLRALDGARSPRERFELNHDRANSVETADLEATETLASHSKPLHLNTSVHAPSWMYAETLNLLLHQAPIGTLAKRTMDLARALLSRSAPVQLRKRRKDV